MRSVIIAALALLSVAATGWAGWAQHRHAQAMAELATTQRALAVTQSRLDQVREAGRIAAEHRNRMATEAAQRDALIAELLSQEGADAPLSDYLRAGAGRVLAAR
jgi:hypothetical protein